MHLFNQLSQNFLKYSILSFLSIFWITSTIIASEQQIKFKTFSAEATEQKVLTRAHNIELMHHVLKSKEYTGYDLIIISSTTQEEADYQQHVLERAFAGTSKENGEIPLILSVIDTAEGGQLIGAIFTWLKAEEKMKEKHPDLMRGHRNLLDYVRSNRSKVAVYHNGGKGERCSPLTQSLGNSRGAQKLVGSVTNALGIEIELEVLLAVVLQCSSFATTNQGTHLDTFWTSQIAFGSYPHDQLIRSNFAMDKFLVGFDKDNLIAQNIADFGTAALSKSGQMMAFYGNKRFASRKGDRYLIDYTKIDRELLKKGNRFAYDFGSFATSFDMWEILVEYWEKKNIFTDMLVKNERSKIKRDIDPHFIQPLIRLLYGINYLADRDSIDQKLPEPLNLETPKDITIAREEFNLFLKKENSLAHSYIWEDVDQEKDEKKKNEAAMYMNEVMEFYLLYRLTPPFSDLTQIFGFVDLGDDTQWFRYRRPIDIMNEKFEMLTDLIGKKIEVGLNGSIQEFEIDDVLLQRCKESRLMRGINSENIVKFSIEGQPVTMAFDEIQSGKMIEGVYIKNSLIQHSDLTKGSVVINSVINNTIGKVIAKNAYIESSAALYIEAETSVVHEVLDIQNIIADREVVSDVYRTTLNPYYHGRMRAPIGYDPKGMAIYKTNGKGEDGKPLFGIELDETISYFIEHLPFSMNEAKEYSDETARTEDGRFTFEQIRQIEPLRIADRSFRESIYCMIKQTILDNRHSSE